MLHAGFRQQTHQQAGVDPAGKQHAHFAGGALADRNGVAQADQQAVAPVIEAQALFVFPRAILQFPPTSKVAIASGIEHHPTGRWQLFHALDQGARRRHHGVEIEVEVQCLRIQPGVQVAALEQCRQAGGEAQALIGARQVERFDAEAVAGEEQALCIPFPDGQCEHAVELG
ncbi:hypothetical protein D9M69_543180 [compost metagenome]